MKSAGYETETMNFPGVRDGVRTMVLDIDGTLLDSNDAHAHAWVDALTEAGFGVAFERIRPLIGMGADQLLPRLAKGLTADADPGKRIAKRRGEIFKRYYLDGLGPTRGARELLLALRERKVTCVVATSATAAEVDLLLARAGVADLVQTTTTAEDAGVSKPAPDIVQAALERSQAQASECVMLGDTRFDVTAAQNAGVAVIALRCGGSDDATLAGADAIYDDPAALSAAIRIS